MVQLLDRRNMHGRRKSIIRRLAAIAMIVRMHRRFSSHSTAETLDSQIGNHLVGVHVGLGAGTGLPDDQRKVVVQIAVDNFSGCIRYRVADFFINIIQRDV